MILLFMRAVNITSVTFFPFRLVSVIFDSASIHGVSFFDSPKTSAQNNIMHHRSHGNHFDSQLLLIAKP